MSWAYAAGRWTHRSIYDFGILKRERLRAPVICVGNLTVGGTGKTPFLIELAAEARRRGYHPAVLSRGYGAVPKAKEPRIISDGKGFLAEVERAGDEPSLIARACPDVPVIIGSRRYAAGCRATEEFSPDLFLLDDGFQHEALGRLADIVLWDLRDRPEEMRLLPAGRLREPLKGVRRAAAIVLTHGEYLDAEKRDEIEKAARRYFVGIAPMATIVRANSRLQGLRTLGAMTQTPLSPLAEIMGRRIFLVSGLARPEGFEGMVREAGLEVAGHLRLPDHAAYSAELIENIRAQASKAGADIVLTTAKDAVKLERLEPGIDIRVAELEMKVEETGLWQAFLERFLPRKNKEESEKGDD